MQEKTGKIHVNMWVTPDQCRGYTYHKSLQNNSKPAFSIIFFFKLLGLNQALDVL